MLPTQQKKSTPRTFLSKMKKPSQIDFVAETLKRDGCIDNVYAFQHAILRLSNKIRALEALGWKIEGSYIEGTKNWQYRLKERPMKKVMTGVEQVMIDGVMHARPKYAMV